MKRLLFILILLFSVSALYSQNSEYTYKSFSKINDLDEVSGRIFVPALYERGYAGAEELDPGEVVIRINQKSVNFEGVYDMSYFNIIQITPSKVGYNIELMDIDGERAKIKLVLDAYNYVDLLYFNSKYYGEHTFFLEQRPKAVLKKERLYYTLKAEKQIEDYASLIGDTIVPYYKLDLDDKKNTPCSINRKESMKIVFEDGEIFLGEESYSVKKVKKEPRIANYLPGIRKVFRIQFKNKQEAFLYLDKRNEMAYFEMAEERFYLKP